MFTFLFTMVKNKDNGFGEMFQNLGWSILFGYWFHCSLNKCTLAQRTWNRLLKLLTSCFHYG
ncbi:hypothetical protein DERF_010996 [Dermatophagoides farinae]|uniref:Uncharacterized protein n=1 Tax=Dermatophagoides farinae TaxID=6954 RepID=A0A922HTR9_DERFA|nr:hypothetical protein DERF_010996 [Dermatophagoides farinae]